MNKAYWISAAALFVLTAWLSAGYHQADEHFQILEFANYKVGLTAAEDLPWEWHERMRPALQPFLAYLVYQMVGWGDQANPFTVALLLRFLSAAFTLAVAFTLFRRYRTAFPPPLGWLFGLTLLFHWFAYYNGVRFSSENWSGLAAVAGFLSYPLHLARREATLTPDGGRSALMAGVWFGLAFLFRYQIALLVAGFGLWLLFVHREKFRNILLLVAGGLGTLAVCYPLSYWLYGEWSLPAWNYLAANLIEGKAATYGTRPWYGYVELVFLRGIPPLSLLYLAGFGAFCYAYRRDPVAWMGLAFVVAHSFLARKDIRFLYPLTPLLPVFLVGALAAFRPWVMNHWPRKEWRIAASLMVLTNTLLLIYVVSRPAAAEIAPLKNLYETYPQGVTLTGPQSRILKAEGAIARYYHRPATVVDTTGQPVTKFALAERPLIWVDRTRDQPQPPAGSALVYTDRPGWLDALNLDLGQKWYYLYSVAPSGGEKDAH
ncbi:hypothetical protein GGR26_001285 [Lewinella marina]|uniref:Glycosyltransferase RgtA/B/C/D-like domain-containing protein n=1 Tax=Neolewinella marina TaxID=438751 RepID=A0A2G0CFN4_9BACT|nr:glycosyltransferase family 39 protein [Neolewinella marina]NJB85540.1 hypothetical protein [Neolewinella marina]PHK98772.1 hypothetical protein CGL56_09930 [Neolewinella marina]